MKVRKDVQRFWVCVNIQGTIAYPFWDTGRWTRRESISEFGDDYQRRRKEGEVLCVSITITDIPVKGK